MQSALAWVWFPVLLYTVSAGCGLLAEAAAMGRGRLPAPLVAPVGFALLTLATYATYRLGGTLAWALAVDLALALGGLALRRRDLRRLWPGRWAVVALAGVLALYLGPIVLSGHWTWAGYNFTNDPSVNFVAVDWIVHHGYHVPAHLTSGYATAAALQIGIHYPLGVHLVLGTLQALSGTPLLAVYQPGIAMAMGFGALAIWWLLSDAGLPGWAAVLGTWAAAGANLLYVYGMLGGIKEVSTAALLAIAAAAAQLSVRQRLSPRSAALAMVPLAGVLTTLSALGFVYAGVLGLAALAAACVQRPRPAVGTVALTAGVAAVAFFVLAAPTVHDAISFGQSAVHDYSSTQKVTGANGPQVLGQLYRPLPVYQSLGIWFARDWRLAVPGGWRSLVNDPLLVLVGLLAVLGIVAGARRRAWGIPLLVATTAITAAVVMPRTSPYGDSKMLIVLSPALVVAAAAGAWALGRRWRWAGAVVAVAALAGFAITDGIVYRQIHLAPTGRLLALQDVGRHAAGVGPVDLNEWEEYGKYLLRDAQPNVGGENFGPYPWQLIHPKPIFGNYFDLDRFVPAYIDAFPAIITRRSPNASRPSSIYRLAYQNAWYQLWLRRPGLKVVDHLPLQGRLSQQRPAPCPAVRQLAGLARPGDRMVAHAVPPNLVLDVYRAPHSPGWLFKRWLGGLIPYTPGQAQQRVFSPGGRYRVWIQGTTGRPLQALVDGRVVGSKDQIDTPQQSQDVGAVTLTRGWHTLELRRGGDSLAPGNGYLGILGPVFLQPIAPDRLISVAPRDGARTFCGRSLDWVELVRPVRAGG